MPELQPARGTQDLLPETMRRHRRVSDTAREQARLYGFAEIATPVFEFTEVFARPIGEHTDIVAKEMYTFNDRGGEEITLRPENTAGVVRAVLSNGLTQSTPLKFFYSGPMFRYERPQKGRFRQFHQIGVELLGLLGIDCRENPRLVRGLDYYTHTVFEFVTTDLGAQGTVLAGGRYDGLVEVMGGPAMPGVGWAAGIERLAMLVGEPPALARPIALVPLGEAAERAALKLGEALRDAGLVVELTYSGNLQRRMRRADRIGARAAVLIGDNELAQNAATLRDLDSGAQELVPLGDLPARLKALAG